MTGLPSVQGNMLPWCPLDLFLTFGCPSVLTGQNSDGISVLFVGTVAEGYCPDPSELQPGLFSFNIFVKEETNWTTLNDIHLWEVKGFITFETTV